MDPYFLSSLARKVSGGQGLNGDGDEVPFIGFRFKNMFLSTILDKDAFLNRGRSQWD